MATVSRYPEAIWKGNGRSGGHYTGGPFRVILHTTETASVPGYRLGYTAPHLTYDTRTHTWFQHTTLLTAARSMRNKSGGVQTNRRSAIQVEIVCYSNKKLADAKSSRLWVGDLTQRHLQDIRDFLMWTHVVFGVNLEWPGRIALNYAKAAIPGFRMNSLTWNRFGGVAGHQHVPENTHWDPGALNWWALFPDQEDEDMKEVIEGIQAMLAGAGYDPGPADGVWGPRTKAAFGAMAKDAATANRKVTILGRDALLNGEQIEVKRV